MSREYSVGWGDEWPQLSVKVPDDAELALFDATYEPHVTDSGLYPGIRTARTLHVKLVFIDLEPEHAIEQIARDVVRHPSGRSIGIVKGEEKQ